MTQKLEQLLNLPPTNSESENESKNGNDFITENLELINEVDNAIDKIDASLPMVRDLEAGDAELDELSDLAKRKAEDLIDLGLNVEPRFSGAILQTAGTLLGHAITAKTAKLDKKLRMIQLQVQKAKLDHLIKRDAQKSDNTGGEAIEGEGVVLDRNELLKTILNKKST